MIEDRKLWFAELNRSLTRILDERNARRLAQLKRDGEVLKKILEQKSAAPEEVVSAECMRVDEFIHCAHCGEKIPRDKVQIVRTKRGSADGRQRVVVINADHFYRWRWDAAKPTAKVRPAPEVPVRICARPGCENPVKLKLNKNGTVNYMDREKQYCSPTCSNRHAAQKRTQN